MRVANGPQFAGMQKAIRLDNWSSPFFSVCLEMFRAWNHKSIFRIYVYRHSVCNQTLFRNLQKLFPISSIDEARQMTNVMFNLLEMTPSLRIIMGRSCLKPIKFIVVSQTVSFHLTIIPFGGSSTCKCFHILEEAATG